MGKDRSPPPPSQNDKYSQHDSRTAVIDLGRLEKIKEQRKTLPIYSFREDIINTIKTHQLLILVGETGSGKTTQISQVSYTFENVVKSFRNLKSRIVRSMIHFVLVLI